MPRPLETRPSLAVCRDDLPRLGEDGYRALVELSPAAVFVHQDDRLVFANARGLALLRLASLAELRSRDPLDFVHPDSLPELSAARQRFREHRGLERVDLRLRCADGTTAVVDASVASITLDGRPASLTVARDVTAQRQEEVSLREAQERFVAAFQHSPTAMGIVDREGTVTEANPAAARLFGLPLGQILGRPAWALLDPAHQRLARANWEGAVAGGVASWTATAGYRTPQGSDGWLQMYIALSGAAGYVVHALDVTAQKASEADLTLKATRDPLTGLPNRSVVLDRLADALSRLGTTWERVTVIFVDLDRFKDVNDTHGHVVGDLVLAEVGNRLRAAVRPDDVVGRLGGDEFAVVITGSRRSNLAEEYAARLDAALAEPISFEGASARLTASVGVASTTDPTTAAVELLGRADAAMYRSRRSE